MPTFAFPAQADPHLLTPERRKAELSRGPPRRVNSLPRTVTWQLSQLLAVQSVTTMLLLRVVCFVAVSVRWVTLFPLGSLLLLLFADVIAIVGHWTSTRVLNFLAGILSVIGGTSCYQAPANHNKRPK